MLLNEFVRECKGENESDLRPGKTHLIHETKKQTDESSSVVLLLFYSPAYSSGEADNLKRQTLYAVTHFGVQ